MSSGSLRGILCADLVAGTQRPAAAIFWWAAMSSRRIFAMIFDPFIPEITHTSTPSSRRGCLLNQSISERKSSASAAAASVAVRLALPAIAALRSGRGRPAPSLNIANLASRVRPSSRRMGGARATLARTLRLLYWLVRVLESTSMTPVMVRPAARRRAAANCARVPPQLWPMRKTWRGTNESIMVSRSSAMWARVRGRGSGSLAPMPARS